MQSFGIPSSPNVDVRVFTGTTQTNSNDGLQVWHKPPGKAMCQIFAVGNGGNGGLGVIGANSNAAGGGGGGSSAQTIIECPLYALPEVLYIGVGLPILSGTPPSAYVSVKPSTTAEHTLVFASRGLSGGDATGSTGGTAGSAGNAATASAMPLGWAFLKSAISGQAGTAGGTTVAASDLAIPTTGLRVMGGTGGGGLGIAGSTGRNGGSYTVPTMPSPFYPQIGGQGSATATDPAANGSHGFCVRDAGLFFYGGTGGASTHGTATGGGLVQSRGGDGAFGCGGGGGGGALTGSAASSRALGGGGLVIITCW